ncbi:FAD-dependent monooxygenase [Spirillospora sp. CA-294931]|uniref:FAD-dependent monooxygenase n=1 Tax=Spirillospora sp. CA-294931 TaxID=3240042 RepID=UPI003D8C4D33
MKTVRTPVLIVGGGLCGLASALFLGRQGVRCLLVERNAGTSEVPRASGITSRTMELFLNVGLEPQIRARGLRIVAGERWRETGWSQGMLPQRVLGARRLSQVGDGTARVLEQNGDLAATGPADPAWCGQHQLEPLMVESARRSGAGLRFGAEVLDFRQHPDEVRAIVKQGDGERLEVRARYMIAADGAAGTIRDTLGIGWSGHGRLGSVLAMEFEADVDPLIGDHRFLICYLSGGTPGLLFRLDASRWVFHLFVDPARHSGIGPSPDECEEVLRSALGEPRLPVRVQSATRWRLAHQVADRYRRGRVFLVGDACHVQPPTGGLGANVGVQDAHNLAWKLAGVLDGWAGEELLDTYESERRPVAMATADQALLRQQVRRRGERGHPDLRDFAIVGTGYRYPSPDANGDRPGEVLERGLRLDGRPGTRVPHVWLKRDGAKVSTVELASDAFVLIAGPEGKPWVPRARAAASRLGVPLHAFQLGDDLTDPEERALPALGLSPSGAMLIRPDGFVTWRSPSAVPHPEPTVHEALSAAIGGGSGVR